MDAAELPSLKLPKSTGKGVAIKQAGQPAYMWTRDMINALPLILKNATILTQHMFTEKAAKEGVDYMPALHKVMRMYLILYKEAREDNAKAIKGLKAIADDMNTDPVFAEVAAAYNSFMTFGLFAYLFSAKEFLIKSPEGLDSIAYEYSAFQELLALSEPVVGTEVMRKVRESGILSGKYDTSQFMRTFEMKIDETFQKKESA